MVLVRGWKGRGRMEKGLLRACCCVYVSYTHIIPSVEIFRALCTAQPSKIATKEDRSNLKESYIKFNFNFSSHTHHSSFPLQKRNIQANDQSGLDISMPC